MSGAKKQAGVLEKGRVSYARRDWADAYRFLSQADDHADLALDDLEMLSWSAALIGREDLFLLIQERIYKSCIDGGKDLLAARSAFWISMRLFIHGEPAQAGGWLSRAGRLIEDRDCAERGYLMLPAAYRLISAGEFDAVFDTVTRAIEIGDRFGEPDLSALARNVYGRALLGNGNIAQGLIQLDEAMLSAASDDVSPIVTGIVYCSVIDGCKQVYALARSREWTAVLAEWCASQPQLLNFTGTCHVHRAEIMALGGEWEDSIAETNRASARSADDSDAVAAAHYQHAEMHRLRGEFAEAEVAYRNANRFGGEPQPGLALLRLAQGRRGTAATAIGRVFAAAGTRMEQAHLLPAYIEIMLAVGDLTKADTGYHELKKIAAIFDSEVLDAIVAHARGAILLARGDAESALAPLRSAFVAWQRFGAPYLAARLRVAVGVACRALGDMDACLLEFESARDVFTELGATPDLDRLKKLAGQPLPHPARPHPLTRRQMQVLRLVATGRTNRAIAGELSVSEKIIDRHVSNIYVKLDVPTRAAATAYAYEHGLVGSRAAG